jgi:DNA polymerase-1
MSHPLLLLFDADMILFESCAAVETEIKWEDDLWTLHSDAADAKAIVDDRVSFITDKILSKLGYEGAYEILMCFTDDNNFRKNILPTYKANRNGKRKPVCYRGVKEWVFENFTTYQRPNLEADDCIGILATTKPNTVIISGDKDFKSVPGRFFNYRKDELYDISEEEANYWHMFQTLIGDTADNYSGCPGIGEKTAQKILAEGYSWDTIVAQFEKKGLTEHDALIQARVARILRKEDYDFKNKAVKLWEPKR